MMNKRFNLLTLVGLTLIIGLLPSCGGDKPNGLFASCSSNPNPNYEEAAKFVAADESILPVITEELEIFHVKKKLPKLYPFFINEQDAVDSLLNLKLYHIFITRQLTPEETKIIESKQHKVRIKPAAYDALALIVHDDNPDSILTVDQFKAILTGKVTTWKEIFPESPYDTIRVAFDNPRSSAVRFCNDSILHGEKMKTTGNVRAMNSSPAVISYVESHKDAIGIIGCNWLNNNRDTTNVTYGRPIKVVGIKVKHPTYNNEMVTYPEQYYIAYGQYPFIRTIYSVCTDPRISGTPSRFHNFCLDPSQQGEGQLVFHNAGMWPAYRDYIVRDVVIK